MLIGKEHRDILKGISEDTKTGGIFTLKNDNENLLLHALCITGYLDIHIITTGIRFVLTETAKEYLKSTENK